MILKNNKTYTIFGKVCSILMDLLEDKFLKEPVN